jgi:hypothetical protein
MAAHIGTPTAASARNRAIIQNEAIAGFLAWAAR